MIQWTPLMLESNWNHHMEHMISVRNCLTLLVYYEQQQATETNVSHNTS